jgi:ribosome-associated protein
MKGLRINSRITIPANEMHFSYVRSGGPGGQNVNKVASKAVLRFNLLASSAIPESARSRAALRLASRLTRSGEIVLSSDAHRDQARNREAVRERLQGLLARALVAPKMRLATAPSAAARERRLRAKKARAGLKRERSRVQET